MHRRLSLIAATLLLTLPVAAGTIASDTATTDVDLDEILSRFAEAQISTETLQATFEERKQLSLFKEAVIQTGRFYHTKPQQYLWDYREPSPKKVLLTDEILLAYYPDLNRAEEVNIRRWSQRIRRYMNIGADPESLRSDYEISLGPAEENDLPGSVLLVLQPKTRKLKARLQELRIWIDVETAQTRRVDYLEPGGDRTVFTFTDIRVNEGIDESLYEIDLPKNVKMGDTFTAFSGR